LRMELRPWRRRKVGTTKEPETAGPETATPEPATPVSVVSAPEEATAKEQAKASYEIPALMAGAMGGPLSETTRAAVESKEIIPEGAGTCAECGAGVEAGARFCTQCAAPLESGLERKEPPPVKPPERGPEDLEPWAVKAGEKVSKLPRWVKVGIPLTIFVIVAILVTLFALAATHSQQAAISRYLGDLKVGNYKSAYELVAHPGGKFSSYDYFQKWQNTTSDKLGRLQEFVVQKRVNENKLFGKLIEPPPATGTAYVVTMKYKDRSFDVNMIVEENGGAWPVQNWKIKLSETDTRLIVAPLGSRMYVDGQFIGLAQQDDQLAKALELRNFPKDVQGAVDYAKKLVQTFQFLVSEFKRLATNLNSVADSAQAVVNRFGTSGFTWSNLLDAADSTVQQSKDFGQDVARIAVHVYWIFGGGDDGSLRARLTRVQSGMDLKNLPEGYHVVTARLPGTGTDSTDWIAPQEAQLELKPTAETDSALKTTMQAYYAATSAAGLTLNPALLKPVVGGDLLVDETNQILDLMGKGQHVVSQLTSLKYDNLKLLNRRVATVETHETWNYTTFQGSTVVASVVGQKQHMVYTLEEVGGGAWKVTERKQL